MYINPLYKNEKVLMSGNLTDLEEINQILDNIEKNVHYYGKIFEVSKNYNDTKTSSISSVKWKKHINDDYANADVFLCISLFPPNNKYEHSIKTYGNHNFGITMAVDSKRKENANKNYEYTNFYSFTFVREAKESFNLSEYEFENVKSELEKLHQRIVKMFSNNEKSIIDDVKKFGKSRFNFINKMISNDL